MVPSVLCVLLVDTVHHVLLYVTVTVVRVIYLQEPVNNLNARHNVPRVLTLEFARPVKQVFTVLSVVRHTQEAVMVRVNLTQGRVIAGLDMVDLYATVRVETPAAIAMIMELAFNVQILIPMAHIALLSAVLYVSITSVIGGRVHVRFSVMLDVKHAIPSLENAPNAIKTAAMAIHVNIYVMLAVLIRHVTLHQENVLRVTVVTGDCFVMPHAAVDVRQVGAIVSWEHALNVRIKQRMARFVRPHAVTIVSTINVKGMENVHWVVKPVTTVQCARQSAPTSATQPQSATSVMHCNNVLRNVSMDI